MKAIGGYFELELSKGKSVYHDHAYALKSGRSSLGCILAHVKPDLVYLPFYTCNALLEPLEQAGAGYRFYEIDENFEPKKLPELKSNEYLLYINYFDIKRTYVQKLSDLYANQLIVDCTQSFFMKDNGKSWFFNSCRKFFGVPDGSFLYAPQNRPIPIVTTRNETFLTDHLIKRFNGDVAGGYPYFLKNEILGGGAVEGMSRLTEYLLSNLDYAAVMEKRRVNFSYLQQALAPLNRLHIEMEDEAVPMYYPLWLSNPINREMLYANGVFIPTFWQDVLNRHSENYQTEKTLAACLYPLPVDQRYTIEDMEELIHIIKKLL